MNKQGSTFAAIGGHLIDLYRLIRFDIRNPYSYSKYRNIAALKKRTGAEVFVETGTFLGNTAYRCSKLFDTVITVELDRHLYEQARRYLASRKNVECIQGDATNELSKILSRKALNNVLIFLDGHFSGGNTALGEQPEPACDEIKSLKPHKKKIVGVIVDDFREFGSANGWPRRSDLLREVEDSLGADFDYTVHLDQVIVWRKQMKK
jgi:hypothetical protein